MSDSENYERISISINTVNRNNTPPITVIDPTIKSSGEGNGELGSELAMVLPRTKPMTTSTTEKININSIQPSPAILSCESSDSIPMAYCDC